MSMKPGPPDRREGGAEEWGGRGAADFLSLVLGSVNILVAGAVEM
jgi:hypothetical protein